MPPSTQDTICRALYALLQERSMDRITVRQVCEAAGLSRQTIYNHYYCLMDVVEDLFQRELTQAIRSCNTYHNWVEGFRTILEYFNARKQVMLHVYHSSYREEVTRMIERVGKELVQRGIMNCAEDFQIEVTERDRVFMLNFYMDVFMGIIHRYLAGRMRESPAYLASRSGIMMDHSIRNTLRKLEQSPYREVDSEGKL